MFKRFVILSLLFSSCGMAAEPALLGVWATQKKEKNATIKIERCAADATKFCGKIIGLQRPTEEDGSPRLDKHNKDENLRGRPLMDLEMLSNFTQADESSWTNGIIYNPEDGDTYSCTIDFAKEDGKDYLDVRGYVGIELFGKTQRWVRTGE